MPSLHLLLALATVAATALSLLRSKRSWVRVWDFPRLQIAALGTAIATIRARSPRTTPSRLLTPQAVVDAALYVAVSYQWLQIWRYTPIAPLQVNSARQPATDTLSILEANVCQSNRDAARLVRLVRARRPDVVVCAETDDRWCRQLEQLRAAYPHVVAVPRDNTYGLTALSRLPLEDVNVAYLVDHDVPSIDFKVRLPSGTRLWLYCVHPRPPVPRLNDSSVERDIELVRVARRVRGARIPVVVCGDLNDVAWSRTTRRFQRVARLVDPRKGRGFYSTFPARWPLVRFPLDHVFHSPSLRLVELRVLGDIGSDHLPIAVTLSHERNRPAA